MSTWVIARPARVTRGVRGGPGVGAPTPDPPRTQSVSRASRAMSLALSVGPAGGAAIGTSGSGLAIGAPPNLAVLGAGEADFGGDFGEGGDDEGDVGVELDAELGRAAVDGVAVHGAGE